jgi:hypothetical protein
MIEAILVVLTKARPGRDDDMNDWYTNIHIRDALRFRGSIAAQRFVLSAVQAQPLPGDFGWTYLGLYDVFDAARFSQEHWDNALTTRMMVSDAIDDSVLEDYHYYPLCFRDNDPEQAHQGGVILEQINPAAGQDAAFRAWYRDEYFPEAMARAGVKSGAFLMFRTYGQMLPTTPTYSYVGIYKVDGPGVAESWADSAALQASCIDQSTLLVTHWDAITPCITKDQVQYSRSDALAAEEAARERMGDKVVTGGRDKLVAQ